MHFSSLSQFYEQSRHGTEILGIKSYPLNQSSINILNNKNHAFNLIYHRRNISHWLAHRSFCLQCLWNYPRIIGFSCRIILSRINSQRKNLKIEEKFIFIYLFKQIKTMETVMLIGFLVVGLLTSFSLIVFSEHFGLFVLRRKNMDYELKQREDFFRKVKNNFTRIKHVTA